MEFCCLLGQSLTVGEVTDLCSGTCFIHIHACLRLLRLPQWSTCSLRCPSVYRILFLSVMPVWHLLLCSGTGGNPSLPNIHKCLFDFLKTSVLQGQDPCTQNRRKATESLVQSIKHFLLDCWVNVGKHSLPPHTQSHPRILWFP